MTAAMLMPKRPAGATPTIALGAMNFGKRTPATESERIVRRALERGVRVFDTANVYNAGESERILGRALGRQRQDAVVATKVGLGRAAVAGGKPEGLSRAAIERAIDASLGRLGTDWVDVYYLHVPDRSTPIDQSLDGMAAVVKSGKVRAWGVSNYASWEILEMNALAAARGLPPPAVSQVLYNVLHRQLEIEYFAFARKHALYTTVYNPLAGGLLTGKHQHDGPPTKGSRFDDNTMYTRRYWTRTMFDRVEELRAIAQAEGITMVQLAYAWVAARGDVDSILVGPASVEHLDDALDAVSRTLSNGALARIDDLGRAWSGTDTNYVR
jgi:aryl-alcohol dehydrogenase-like predicted oxidoreductase